MDEELVEVAVEPQAELEVVRAEEEPKSYWEQQGFEESIAKMCTYLEEEPEKFLFNAEVRHIIQLVMNAQMVEDFDRYSLQQLDEFNQTLRRQVPQAQQQMVSLISQLSRARTVQVDDIDYI